MKSADAPLRVERLEDGALWRVVFGAAKGNVLDAALTAIPAFAALANLTWFGWTVDHQPLAGQSDWISLVPVAVVATVLLAVGVVAGVAAFAAAGAATLAQAARRPGPAPRQCAALRSIWPCAPSVRTIRP